MKKLLILLMFFCLVYAGGVGTTGANYLKIGLGAKATALAENFTALADDTSAAYWNPAGLTTAKSTQVDYMQINWIAGISSKTMAAVYPLSETDYLGGYLFMLETPSDKETVYDVDNANAYKETGDKFNSGINVMDLAYSKLISAKLSVGLGLKVIDENLAGEKNMGYAADLGFIYKDLYPSLSLGATLQNITVSKLHDEEELPMTIALGAAYQKTVLQRKLNLVSDLKFPNDNEMRYGVGAEYWLADVLAARVGYNNFHKFTFGVGLQIASLTADYAYMPLNDDLGVAHRISVGYKFFSAAIEKEEPIKKEEKKYTPRSIDDLFGNSEKTEPLKQDAAPEQTDVSADDLFGSIEQEESKPLLPAAPVNEPAVEEDLFTTFNDQVAVVKEPAVEIAKTENIKPKMELVKKNIIAGSETVKCYYKILNTEAQEISVKAKVYLYKDGVLVEARTTQPQSVVSFSEALIYQPITVTAGGQYTIKAELFANNELVITTEDTL